MSFGNDGLAHHAQLPSQHSTNISGPTSNVLAAAPKTSSGMAAVAVGIGATPPAVAGPGAFVMQQQAAALAQRLATSDPIEGPPPDDHDPIFQLQPEDIKEFRRGIAPHLFLSYKEFTHDGPTPRDALIASGGFGYVYRMKWAKSVSETQLVAVKKVPKNTSLDSLFHEVRLVTALAPHPNIIAFLGVVIEDGRCWIVMPLAQQSLRVSVVQEQQSQPRPDYLLLARRALQLFRAVHHLAKSDPQRKVNHRDIKPDNVLVFKDVWGHEVLQLCDFGLASVSEHSSTGSKWEGGTPGYRAPEANQQDARTSAHTDVYALGKTMWHTATGRRPDPHTHVVDEQGLVHLDCPEPLIDLIRKCCAVERKDRPTLDFAIATLQGIIREIRHSRRTDDGSHVTLAQAVPPTPWEDGGAVLRDIDDDVDMVHADVRPSDDQLSQCRATLDPPPSYALQLARRVVESAGQACTLHDVALVAKLLHMDREVRSAFVGRLALRKQGFDDGDWNTHTVELNPAQHDVPSVTLLLAVSLALLQVPVFVMTDDAAIAACIDEHTPQALKDDISAGPRIAVPLQDAVAIVRVRCSPTAAAPLPDPNDEACIALFDLQARAAA